MYLIDGRHLGAEDPRFAGALASAYANHERPLCLCNGIGVQMYVARFGGDYLIKRMPYTGSKHATACGSYEPQLEESGDGPPIRSAIVEDPDTGLMTLRLGFALSHWGSQSPRSPGQPADADVSVEGSTLSLGGLLRYLWNRAQLTRWRPEFEGKRSWSTVRRLILAAASTSLARGEPLRRWLYVPETFAVERREEIAARRTTEFRGAVASATGPRRLRLLCGEVKEIALSRHGAVAVIKHVPDQPFALDERIYRRMERRFEQELSFWDTAPGCHMVMLATFALTAIGVPTIEQLTLMPVDEHWIPVGDRFENELVQRLARERRSFISVLPCGASNVRREARVVLTDAGDTPVPMRIVTHSHSMTPDAAFRPMPSDADQWLWRIDEEAMPLFPPRRAARRNIESPLSAPGAGVA